MMTQERPTDNSAEHGVWMEPSVADTSSDAQSSACLAGTLVGKLSRSTIMMAVMFMVGAGWVIWEARNGGGFELTEQDRKNEGTVSAGLVSVKKYAEPGAKHRCKREKMLHGLGVAADRRQAPLGELGGKAFLFNRSAGPKPSVAKSAIQFLPAAVSAVVQPPPVEGLALQSVITGPVATAIISGDIVREGMTIGGWAVERIRPREVTLKWREMKHRLLMP